MKNLLKVGLIIFTILLNSCGFISINGSLQGITSYYDSTIEINPNLITRLNDSISICDIEPSDSIKVVLTNGKEIKKCIAQYDKAIVYIWSPYCSSKYCYSPTLLQYECDKNNIELFIVAEYFDSKKMTVNYSLNKPIFGIDIKYYKSNLTSKYLSKFIFDLTLEEKEVTKDLIYFNNGNYIKSFRDIDDLLKY